MSDILLTIYFSLLPIRDFLLYRLRGMSDQERNTDIKSTTLERILFWGIPNGIDSALFTYLILSNGNMLEACGAGLLAGWGGAAIGHSSSQGPGWSSYVRMGLITTAMLTIMLFPVTTFYWRLVFFFPMGFLGILASWLGYSSLVANRTLTLFGIQFCGPVSTEGSTWEEAFIGLLPFGCTKAAIGMFLLFGGAV